jgi:hypothetical protein
MSSNGQLEQDTGQKRRYLKAHIESWSKSGLSQVDYCRVNNLVPHRFGYWKKRLKAADGNVSFIPIQLPDQLPVAVEKRPFNLFTPNGYRIEINDGFNPTTLHRLIAVVNRL